MNKNATALILIVLALGIYFTFTSTKIKEFREVSVVNEQYESALSNSENLVKVRDRVLASYNQISPDDQDRLDKIIPNNVDNVRLIIDVLGVASRHGIAVKNVKTSTSNSLESGKSDASQASGTSGARYSTVTLNFDITTDYLSFLSFLRDLESSLRILEVSKISLKVNEAGLHDYGIELKTYWLKQ
jgi:Tfp pilus assembly protein PilO